MKEILVIDGQGGGLGRSLIIKLKEEIPTAFIRALGTNSAASTAMLRAGADEIATGENAIVWGASKADIIVGGIGIIAANALMGEISPAMALAVSSSDAYKFLIPLGRCHFRVANSSQFTLPELISATVAEIKEHLEKEA